MTDAAAAATGPKGLGGWMILVVIGNFLAILTNGADVIGTVRQVSSLETDTVDPILGLLVQVQLFAQAIITMGWIIALILLFRRQRSYPPTFITLMVATLIISLVVVGVPALTHGIAPSETDVAGLVQIVLPCLIWIPYMLKSRRVKNTFIE